MAKHQLNETIAACDETKLPYEKPGCVEIGLKKTETKPSPFDIETTQDVIQAGAS